MCYLGPLGTQRPIEDNGSQKRESVLKSIRCIFLVRLGIVNGKVRVLVTVIYAVRQKKEEDAVNQLAEDSGVPQVTRPEHSTNVGCDNDMIVKLHRRDTTRESLNYK
jgi:hypothetical protein